MSNITISGIIPSSNGAHVSTQFSMELLAAALDRSLQTWPDAPVELFELHASLTIDNPQLLADTIANIRNRSV